VVCIVGAGSVASGAERGATSAVTVHIFRDTHGVPHVKAATDAAALYGLGWATASDRLFQMHVQLWSAQGRMAEFFGPAHIDADREARLFGVWRHAQQVAAGLTGESSVLLQAYADGVNAYVAAHPDAAAALFDLVDAEPVTWAPEHSIAVWNRFANFFSNSPLGKAAEYYKFWELVERIGLERAIASYQPKHPGDPTAAVVQEADVPPAVLQSIMDYADSLGYGDDPEGFAAWHANPSQRPANQPSFSHAWAVSGARTSTGKAVLVGDPQVPVSFPNLLYEWRAAGATFNVRGISPPGAPAPLIGFNQTVAWSLTAVVADNRDLMRLHTTTGGYLFDNQVLPFVVHPETIKVAGGPDVPVTYRESVWGPVVTELVETQGNDEWALHGIPFTEDDRDTFTGALAMMRATSMSAFHQATDGWRHPTANLVAADSSGNVFYILIGAVPVRSTRSPLGGLIGQEGHSSHLEWQDIIPAQFKPWVMNPPAGWVASGNHRVESGWYPLPLGLAPGGHTIRSASVYENLKALPPVSTPAQIFANTQFDCANVGRRGLVAVATHVRNVGAGGLGAHALAAIGHLSAWLAAGGFDLTGQSGVGLAMRIDTMFRVGQAGPDLIDIYGGGEAGLNLFLADHLAKIAADPGYVPDADSIAYLDKVLGDAWRQASIANPDPGQWDADYAAGPIPNPFYPHFASPFLVGSPLGNGVTFDPATLQCADGNTVWSQGGQTYTQMVDLARVDRSLSIMPPGDTENPATASWNSQAAGWIAGTYKPAPLSDAAVNQIKVSDEILTYPG